MKFSKQQIKIFDRPYNYINIKIINDNDVGIYIPKLYGESMINTICNKKCYFIDFEFFFSIHEDDEDLYLAIRKIELNKRYKNVRFNEAFND